jgi:hypothetical protein
MRCKEIELLIPLYACEELDEAQRSAVAEHLTACAACQGVLERERRLLEVVQAGRVEPSAVLLASCRNELTDALDVTAPRHAFWERLKAVMRPPRWAFLHPAWSAAMFLVVGVVVGTQVPSIVNRPRLPQGPSAGDVVVRESSPFSDLQNVSITGINVLPGGDSGAPRVELQVRAEQPMVVSGTLDDNDERRALTYVVQNNQRFDSGLRLDATELLKSHGADEDVREALCYAVQHDRNPAVRLKAMEALRGFGQDPKVRQALIDVLLKDDNAGVRVEAVTTLRAIAEQGAASQDARLLEVLRDRMQRDPSTFVRMQSAAAVRQLEPRATY